ncbi:hypothetical protein I3843_05G164900 [Carya illinoinensis]|nr:hypothetical protein I3843_05G164900 [Carya illinoinensis]
MSNLSILLSWSPFSTEGELLKLYTTCEYTTILLGSSFSTGILTTCEYLEHST